MRIRSVLPWKIHEPGTLRMEEATRCHDHVASPDMHVTRGPTRDSHVLPLPVDVLTPERDYEGHSLPLEVTAPDEAPGRVRQLRDPGIFSDNRRTYLLYSIAGESGLAIGELGSQ